MVSLPLLNWQNLLIDSDEVNSLQGTSLYINQSLAKDLEVSLSRKKNYGIFLNHLNKVQRKCSRYPWQDSKMLS